VYHKYVFLYGEGQVVYFNTESSTELPLITAAQWMARRDALMGYVIDEAQKLNPDNARG
jgi:zona occludens toxin (predicted ATPase)